MNDSDRWSGAFPHYVDVKSIMRVSTIFFSLKEKDFYEGHRTY